MNGVEQINLMQFLMIYTLLILVLFIMKRCNVDYGKLLVIASMKMTIQLIIAGYILTYIFKDQNPIFTVLYVVIMTIFAIHRVLSKNYELNKKFKIIIATSISLSGIFIVLFFVSLVIGKSAFNSQYMIPISGMVIGNTMTGVSLAIKTFKESMNGQKTKINALLCAGVSPRIILFPFVKQSFETALLPTLNSMVGMGIVSLPGMMTGQILAGTLPTVAILYQIGIMISICTAVSLACFGSLYFGYKTLYDNKKEIMYDF